MTPTVRTGLVVLFMAILAACSRTDLSELETGGEILPPPVDRQDAQKIRVVGSSTVAPFATTVAERFGATTRYPTPIVETTGTGGGFKTFCQRIGPDHPSIADASRRVHESETQLCASNGITSMTEIDIGFDGIVLANARDAPALDLRKVDLYRALAANLPDGQGGFVSNPHDSWARREPGPAG